MKPRLNREMNEILVRPGLSAGLLAGAWKSEGLSKFRYYTIPYHTAHMNVYIENNTCMCIYMYTSVHNIHVYVYTCTHTGVHTYIYIYIHTFLYMHTFLVSSLQNLQESPDMCLVPGS